MTPRLALLTAGNGSESPSHESFERDPTKNLRPSNFSNIFQLQRSIKIFLFDKVSFTVENDLNLTSIPRSVYSPS